MRLIFQKKTLLVTSRFVLVTYMFTVEMFIFNITAGSGTNRDNFHEFHKGNSLLIK